MGDTEGERRMGDNGGPALEITDEEGMKTKFPLTGVALAIFAVGGGGAAIYFSRANIKNVDAVSEAPSEFWESIHKMIDTIGG